MRFCIDEVPKLNLPAKNNACDNRGRGQIRLFPVDVLGVFAAILLAYVTLKKCVCW